MHGPNDARVDDVAAPDPGLRDVVVQVAACGICGTDLSYISHGGLAGPGPEPMALGHEMAGVVDWVGRDVEGVAAGDRLVVHPGNDELGRIGNGAAEGGLTPVLLVREAVRGTRLFPVPDGVALDIAALTEPLNVGMHAVEQSDEAPGETVAVFGCGPIGLAAIATLRDRGVERVVGVDLSAARREIAIAMGAEAVLDPTTDDVWRELARLHGTARSMSGVAPATDVYIEASRRAAGDHRCHRTGPAQRSPRGRCAPLRTSSCVVHALDGQATHGSRLDRNIRSASTPASSCCSAATSRR